MTEIIIKEKGIDFNKAQGTRNDFLAVIYNIVNLAQVKEIEGKYRLVGHTINCDFEALQFEPTNEEVDISKLVELTNKYRRATGNENRDLPIG